MPPVLVRGADFRFDPVSGKMEAASGPAQFGSTISDFGDRFISQNTTHIRHVVVPMEYLARAPLLEVGAVAQDISDHGRPSARMFPLTGPQEWRKERTNLRQQRYNDNKSNVTEQVGGWFTAASEELSTMATPSPVISWATYSRGTSAEILFIGTLSVRMAQRISRIAHPKTKSFLPRRIRGSGRAISPMRPTATCTSPTSTGR